jgi:asparagine synthase (glutamine-hydrolysing)
LQDESDEARKTAKLLKSSHTEITLEDSTIESDFLEFASSIDQPSVDGVNSFFVSKAVSKFSKVVLSGTGGDELFAGYPWFESAKNFNGGSIQEKISRIVRENSFMIAKIPKTFDYLAYKTKMGIFSKGIQVFGYANADKLINNTIVQLREFNETFLDFESRDINTNLDELSRFSIICLNGYTKNQLLRDIDSTSMHFSLEVRVPYLDLDLLNFSLGLPDEWKLGPKNSQFDPLSYKGSGQKYLLAKLSEQYLPKDLLQRRKKGFDLPLSDWLDGPLNSLLISEINYAKTKGNSFLKMDQVEEFFKNYKLGKEPAIRLWLILLILVWHKNLEMSHSYI